MWPEADIELISDTRISESPGGSTTLLASVLPE
jgi:hypothetical protein